MTELESRNFNTKKNEIELLGGTAVGRKMAVGWPRAPHPRTVSCLCLLISCGISLTRFSDPPIARESQCPPAESLISV